MKSPDANLPTFFAFIFPECIKISSSKEALQVCKHTFFQEI